MIHTYILDVLLRSITGYFYELCRIMTSPLGKSKYKQRVKFSAILHNQTSHKRLSNMPNCYVHAGEFHGHLFMVECLTEVCKVEWNWHKKSS